MYTVVLLLASDRYQVEHWEEIPMIRTWEGVEVSLRAGPRERTSQGRTLEPLAVYVPDDLNEEEFQDIFFEFKDKIPELRLTD